MPAPFPPEIVSKLDSVGEIEIETGRSADAARHRTIVWIVVADGQAYLRSYRGPGARWYRESLTGGPVKLIVDGGEMPVTLEPAREPDAVEAVSRAYERKYAGDPATPAMIRPEVLDTTLRVHPG